MKKIVECSIHNHKIMVLNLPEPINDLRNEIVKRLLEWDYKGAVKVWKKLKRIIDKNKRASKAKKEKNSGK